MKKVGIGVFIFGLICLFAALSMDTSVSTHGGRVNNLGLMNNKLISVLLFIAVTITGVVLWVLGGRSVSVKSPQGSPKISDLDQATRPCPYCAEQIKARAIVCRYCNREVNPIDVDVLDSPNEATTTEIAKGQWSARLGSAFTVIRDVVEKANRELSRLNVPYKKILKIVLAFFAIVIVVGLLGNLLPSEAKEQDERSRILDNIYPGLETMYISRNFFGHLVGGDIATRLSGELNIEPVLQDSGNYHIQCEGTRCNPVIANNTVASRVSKITFVYCKELSDLNILTLTGVSIYFDSPSTNDEVQRMLRLNGVGAIINDKFGVGLFRTTDKPGSQNVCG